MNFLHDINNKVYFRKIYFSNIWSCLGDQKLCYFQIRKILYEKTECCWNWSLDINMDCDLHLFVSTTKQLTTFDWQSILFCQSELVLLS